MPAAHCAICLNHFAIDSEKLQFSIFPCGHGYCSKCIDGLFTERRAKCPNCRKPIQKRDGHPVYLELVDSEKLVTQTVIEGLEKMDADTPLVSFKKAGQKLEQAMETVSEDSQQQLFRAVMDLKDRTMPVYAKLETQKQDNEKLRQELQRCFQAMETMQSKLRESESLTKEIARLRLTLAETEANTEQALRLAEAAKDQLEKERRSVYHWKASMQSMESENKRLRDANERHKITAQNDKEKHRKLYSKYAALKMQRQNEETQQVVLDSVHDYDADFSSHENSKIHSLHGTIRSSPPRATRRSYTDENEVELDCQGMPPPTFTSDWQFNGSVTGILKKRAPNGLVVNTHRRVAQSFPIELDRKGHPIKAVQLGPRSIVHVRR